MISREQLSLIVFLDKSIFWSTLFSKTITNFCQIYQFECGTCNLYVEWTLIFSCIQIHHNEREEKEEKKKTALRAQTVWGLISVIRQRKNSSKRNVMTFNWEDERKISLWPPCFYHTAPNKHDRGIFLLLLQEMWDPTVVDESMKIQGPKRNF